MNNIRCVLIRTICLVLTYHSLPPTYIQTHPHTKPNSKIWMEESVDALTPSAAGCLFPSRLLLNFYPLLDLLARSGPSSYTAHLPPPTGRSERKIAACEDEPNERSELYLNIRKPQFHLG